MMDAVPAVYIIPAKSLAAQQFARHAHDSTNHFYDEDLPYTFHLKLVVNACNEFAYKYFKGDDIQLVASGCWLHDTIEDTRTSFNDIVAIWPKDASFAREVANIVFAVTNEKGKTRKDRANDKYYADIKANKLAVFVKLCDRIANVGYSKLTQSSMFKKYQHENDEFLEKIGALEHGFHDMVDRLESLLNK